MSERPLLAQGRSEIVWVSGADHVSFLDGLLSQSIGNIPVGGTARSLLLAPNGKLRATLFVLRGADRVGLVCDAGRAEVVAGDLRRFKIRVDVDLTVDERPVWEMWGRDLGMVTDAAPPAGEWSGDGEVIRFRMPWRHGLGERMVVVGARPDGVESAPERLEAYRIAAGEPVMGVDLDENTIPQEGVDVTMDVDFAKGCYLGQELVARIDSRGHVNKRLVGVSVDGGMLPERGCEILMGGKPVGTITSAATSPDEGRVIALAMIRTEAGHGTVVTVGGADGEVVSLPFP